MSRPTENPQDGITIRIPNLFGGRNSKKIRIKKRPKSPSERRSPRQVFADWRKGASIWLSRMASKKNPAYRKVFFGALWGEMGEYGIRGSTFVGFVFFILAITMIRHLPGLRYSSILGLIWLVIRYLITGVFFVIAFLGLRDLGGPIWWADRYSCKQAKNFKNGKKVEYYDRYGNVMARLRQQHQIKLPLKGVEICRLAELYRQFCRDTLSEESWEELEKYTKEQVDFFYKIVGIGEGQKHFPEHTLKQPEASESDAE